MKKIIYNKGNIFKNKTIKTIILTSVICFLATGIVGVTALTLYADDIIYNPSNSQFTVDNANDALNQLYTLVSSGGNLDNLKITTLYQGGMYDRELAETPTYSYTFTNSYDVAFVLTVGGTTKVTASNYKKGPTTKITSLSMTTHIIYNPKPGDKIRYNGDQYLYYKGVTVFGLNN